MARRPDGPLRTGFTTGACATAATRAAIELLITGTCPTRVTIPLPKDGGASFEVDQSRAEAGWAEAGIIKDAGDDPDVTHGVTVIARVAPAAPGSGITFCAGEGVGTVTRAGLPIGPGEPAINPVPRQMMEAAVAAAGLTDLTITIAIPGGAKIAEQTWNPRLGIEGGLSVLGTTGIVRPFSCAAWIASIHRGIDVARAAGLPHVAGCTGATSETAVQAHLALPDHGMLDMGDFAGGMLKYLARHPVAKLTIGGGFGKLTKLAQGHLDLHSARSQVDFAALATLAETLGADPAPIAHANTALEALTLCPALASAIAAQARAIAQARVPEIEVAVVVVSRDGVILAEAP